MKAAGMRYRPGTAPGRTPLAAAFLSFIAIVPGAAQGEADTYREIVLHLDAATTDSAPVIEIASGERIRLVIHGLGAREVHLHGYDRHLRGNAGTPTELEFEAAHSGRFPAMVHTHDALLGEREEALFYLEIRDR